MRTWEEPELFPDMSRGRFAIRAKKLVTMAGEEPARGWGLYNKLTVRDNPLILVENGIITDIKSGRGSLAFGYKKIDIGDRCVLPPLVNAHTHLQLSFMEGGCALGYGFIAWLEDLILHLSDVLINRSEWTDERRRDKLASVFRNLKNCGTGWIGDIGGSITGELPVIHELAKDEFGLIHFCEWFGFNQELMNIREVWPYRCRNDIKSDYELWESSAPCGHALYSTALPILKRAKNWCRNNGRVFTMHLAESMEEGQCVRGGSGDLYDLYNGKVIPPGWKPYLATPYETARGAGLVDQDSLFVHCVYLYREEIEDLAERNAAVCLCPRSNALIGVGSAPLKNFIEKNVRLCLGTDGLSSNIDLNVLNEAVFLMEKFDLPFASVLRLCTVNGADALKLAKAPRVAPGCRARFSSISAHYLDY